MNNNRPKNLSLLTIKFPVMAIASIAHRTSGVILFLFIPLMLWIFDQSLASSQSFLHIKQFCASVTCKLLIWVMLSAIIYHLSAGIRHLCMDTGHCESLKAGRISSYIVFAVSFVFIVFTGIWLW